MGKSNKGKRRGGKYDSEDEEEGYFDSMEQLEAEEGSEEDDEVPEEVPEGYDIDDWRTGGIIDHASADETKLLSGSADDSAEKWRAKGSKTLKTLRHFSYALLDRALAAHFDTEQIADILSLIIAEMGYQKDLDGLRKLLERVSVGPSILAALQDRGLGSLPPSTVLSLLSLSGDSADKFIKYIGDALEMDVLNVHRNVAANEDLFSVVSSFVQSSFDLFHKKCLAVTVCEHLPHKAHCARFLHHLTSTLPSPRDRARFISEVITKEYFRDVMGKMKDFKTGLTTEVADQLEILLGLDFEVDNEGELLESDADSDGNLRDFVVEDVVSDRKQKKGKKQKQKGDTGKGKNSESSSDSSGSEDEEFDENSHNSDGSEEEDGDESSPCSSNSEEDNSKAKKKPSKIGKAKVNFNESSDEDAPTTTTTISDNTQPAKRRKILDSDDEN